MIQEIHGFVIIIAYPSSSCVDWTVTVDGCVLVEVLRHGQTKEDREAQYELCSEAV